MTIKTRHDKLLHLFAFFLLTVCFYWILDTSRRRALHLTLIVCTLLLGISSEVVQALIPNNGRFFDPYDVAANIIGSFAGLGLCSWYHKRMLERRRASKQFHVVPGEGEADLELGEQESGVTQTLEDQVDTWDENVEDNWDDDDDPSASKAQANGEKDDPASTPKIASEEET
ncbi:MAG: hypothetical protein M1814_000514 [Vezdaea aestivalis]|nr:MAG: hypothetical protein M1814_000514 [Vezdaea aestivalis]